MAIAEFHLRRGRHLEALQAYQKVVSLKEDLPRDVDVIAHLGLARIFMLQNMIIEAYKELLLVFELSPRDVEGRVLYTWLSHIKEPPSDTQEAFGSYEKDEQPALEDLKVFRHQKELEKSILEQEISQFEQIMNAHDGEPIYEYHYEMAIMRKKQIEEMLNYIDILESYIEQKTEEQRVQATLVSPEEMAGPLMEEAPLPPPEEVEEIKEKPEQPEMEVEPIEPQELESPEQEILEPPAAGDESLFEIKEVTEGEEVSFITDQEALAEESIQIEIVDEKTHLQELEDLLGTEDASITEEKPELPEEAPVEEKPAVSPERINYYESIKESITTVLATLIKTKGVTVVLTIAVDGVILDSILNEAIAFEEISECVKTGIEVIRTYRQDEAGKAFLYWVLEFEQGLLVMRSIDGYHFLMALAKAGANFGAMRYSMEKGKETLVEILGSAPQRLFEMN